MANKKPKPVVWTRRDVNYTPPVYIRCLYHTRVVVGGDRTASGTRYEFEPGEVKAVLDKDAPSLLALEKQQPPGCCGGSSNPPVLKYFEVA